MNSVEEVIDATLDADGTLRLSQRPQLDPGPVRVTIRASLPGPTLRTLADVVREIAADQRARGYPGRTVEEVQAETDAGDKERDRELGY